MKRLVSFVLIATLLVGAAVLTMASIPASMAADENDYLAGDVDGNGKLTVRDVVLTMRCVAGGYEDDLEALGFYKRAADVDNDAKTVVTVSDALMIARAVVNNDTTALHKHTVNMAVWSSNEGRHWHPSTCGHTHSLVAENRIKHTLTDDTCTGCEETLADGGGWLVDEYGDAKWF